MAHRKAGHAEISVCSKSALQLYTCRSFKTVVRDLQDAKRQWQAGTMAKELYTDLCKACGFEVTPYGVWSSPRLVDDMFLPESMRYDWPHTLLQDGPFNIEFAKWRSGCVHSVFHWLDLA